VKVKRTLAAAVLVAFAMPVLAADYGPPYEQTVADMALPNVNDPVVNDSASTGATLFGIHEDKPYEQVDVDMALPNVKDPVVSQPVQVAGPATAVSSPEATGAFANDFNFIAPPQ
jgi:hypothetical protein